MIPDASDPRWKRLVTTDADISRASLATRILVSRLRADVRRDPGTLASRISELREFFKKNDFAQRDIALF